MNLRVNTLAAISGAPNVPSADSAHRFVIHGEWAAVPTMVSHLLGRSLFVYLGQKAFTGKATIKGAIAGAAGIEAFLFAWVLLKDGKDG